MYEYFNNELFIIERDIKKGQYPSFYKIYHALDSLENQIYFAYSNDCLTYLEYNDLAGKIAKCLQLFQSLQYSNKRI